MDTSNTEKSLNLKKNSAAAYAGDIIYAAAVICFTSVCYKLFYRMAVNYNKEYPSDIPYYLKLPVSENKETYRLLGWVFNQIYRHSQDISWMVAYLAIVMGCLILANLVYLKFFTAPYGVSRTALEITSLLVPFMGPIYVPHFREYYYAWTFQSFAWHSPTQQSMMLISLFSLLCFIKMYEESDKGVSKMWWILTMLTGLLSAFAKPAFIINLIAAMVVLFIIDLFVPSGGSLAEKFKKRFIMGCSLIPSGLYILYIMQYEYNGHGASHSGGVEINLQHILDYNNLPVSIMCSLAFPIVVWTVNIRLLKEKRYRTAFMVFIMGIVQWIPFVETGFRAKHGNFSWGRHAGCYIIFITSAAIALNNWKDRENFMPDRPVLRKLYFALIAVLLFLHIGSQIQYFYLIWTGQGYVQ